MMHATYQLWKIWEPLGWILAVLGFLTLAWAAARWIAVEREQPRELLHQRDRGHIRWWLDHRRRSAPLVLGVGMLVLGLLAVLFRPDRQVVSWIVAHPREFLGFNAGLAVLAGLTLLNWDSLPRYVKRGEGRAAARFLDPMEDWSAQEIRDGRPIGPEHPTAVLLGYRERGKLSELGLTSGQRKPRNLLFVSLRWETLSRHILVVGATGSGKTTAIFGHVMASSYTPWIYQDSKADLPFLSEFPDRPVWGLDARGHRTRSAIWNPMEEVRSAEDRDLIVDYVLPRNSRDANPWVREMARTFFAAILKSRSWASLQEIGRAIQNTRLEPFLGCLPPIWQDLMKEERSRAAVLQDLVSTLENWESPRIRAITEGHSTVSLNDFIYKGGYVMNSEMGDGLRAPVHLFWAMLLGRLRDRPEGASPLLLLLDEFGDAGKLPNIERALVLLRSKGVSIMAGIQNLGLLEQVYDRDWKAVLEGFGSRIWLTRNLDEELREKLSRALGKWTRRLPAANAQSKETEKECDLMPLDAWTLWSQERAALARMHGFTYWLPCSLPIPETPRGVPSEGNDEQAVGGSTDAQGIPVELPESWPAHLPAIPPDPAQWKPRPPEEAGPGAPDSAQGGPPEEDWL